MNLEFAPATKQDVDIIYGLCKDLIDRYEDTAAIDYPAVLSWVRKKIELGIGDYIRVLLHGEPVAYYHFSPCDDMMELDDLYVLPEYRGRGVGTKIIEHCLSQTDLPVMLYVFTRNTGAIRLYERMGFCHDREVGATRCVMIRESV